MKKLIAFAGIVSVSYGFAATYYWKGAAETFGLWTERTNWSTESITGVDAQMLPGEKDTLARQSVISIDLAEQEAVLGVIDTTATWDRHWLNLKNGSLKLVGSVTTHSLTLNLSEGAKVWYDCEYRSSQGHGAADEIFVSDGCEWKMTGVFNNYKLETHVASGGKVIFDPSYFGVFWTSGQNSYFDIAGEFELPHGVNWQNGGFSSADSYFDFRLKEGGLLKLGGDFVRKESLTGKLKLTMYGGTLEATENVKFSGAEVSLSGQTDFKVADGKTLDLSGISFGWGAAASKSGPGTALFTTAIPDQLYLWGGDITIGGENLTFAGSVSSASPCGVKIAAKGFTMAATAYSEVKYSIDSSVFDIGDTILTCENAEQLVKAQADLAAVGVATTIDGTTLKRAVSEIVFDSTVTTDFLDPKGWKSGTVPSAGMEVMIAGEGVKAIVSSEIPAFGGITVKEGATLEVAYADTALPMVRLMDGAKLILTRTTSLAGIDAVLVDDKLNELTVATDATLKVPGNTKFTNVALDLKGSLVATSDGKLVFGYAKADETAKFAMTTDGATITALNAAKKENAARLDFVCPEPGGRVIVTEPIVLKNTTLTHDKEKKDELDGMAFGLNNPVDQAFMVTAEKTDLYVGAETTIAGAANLVLNGSRLIRWRHAEGDNPESNYNIVVQNKGKITVGEGGSIYAGVTRVNGNVTDGVIRLNPDEPGFVGIEVLDGGTAHWYKSNGLDKGAISFANSTFEMTKSFWWSWGNRSHLFNKMKSVDLAEGKKLTFTCVKEGVYSSNNDSYTYFILESPFTGAGDLYFTSARSSQTMQPTFVCNNNTCTGTLSIDPEANVKVHFAKGANWAGTVVLSDKVDFTPADQDHTAENGKPTELTFGAVKLERDLTLRLWGEDGFANDKINISGEGWTCDEGKKLVFAVQDGYDPKQGDKWLLGTAPATAKLPATTEKWAFAAEPLEGEDGRVNVYLTPAAVEYNFVSNGEGTTNLNEPSAWTNGSVPTGKEVSIVGENVIAEVNSDQGLPSFASITLKGGAMLKINADLTETELPSIAVDALSRIVVAAGAVVKLPISLTTNAKAGEETVALTKILVEKDGTLVIPAGMSFKNVDLEVYGTVKSEGNGTLAFGTANVDETSYFALKAEGATFNLPGRDNTGITVIDWLSPAAGGRVKAVGEISLKDCKFPFGGWADYHEQNFCTNNPEDEKVTFVFDNTVLQASYKTYFRGAATVVLKNGGYMTRSGAFAGHGGDMDIGDQATIVCEGADSGISFNVTTTQSLLINTSTTEPRDVIVLKDGAYINVRRVFAYNGAGIKVEKQGYLMMDKPNDKEVAFYSGARVTVAKDAVCTIEAAAWGAVGTNADRDIVFLGQFSGAGDVEIANLTDKKFNVLLMNGSHDFTGSIKVVPPEGETEANATTMTFAANDRMGLDWTGAKLVLDSHVKMAEDGVTLTFGEINVAEDYALRFDENAPAGMLDMINATGKGFTGDGKLIIAVSETFNPGKTVYPLGTIAKGAAQPKLKGNYWKVVTAAIEGDDANLACGLKRNLGFVIHFR